MSVSPLARVRVEDQAVEPATLVPLALNLDDADTPADVVDALALGEFTSGRQPWARSLRIDRVRADAPLVVPGARVIRSAHEEGRYAHLAAGDGWTLHAVRWRNRAAYVA